VKAKSHGQLELQQKRLRSLIPSLAVVAIGFLPSIRLIMVRQIHLKTITQMITTYSSV
jgi:hypothetical protein